MSAFITHINQLVIKHLPGIHNQKKHSRKVYEPGMIYEPIDPGIADIVTELRRIGVVTINSCEGYHRGGAQGGNKGPAYITEYVRENEVSKLPALLEASGYEEYPPQNYNPEFRDREFKKLVGDTYLYVNLETISSEYGEPRLSVYVHPIEHSPSFTPPNWDARRTRALNDWLEFQRKRKSTFKHLPGLHDQRKHAKRYYDEYGEPFEADEEEFGMLTGDAIAMFNGDGIEDRLDSAKKGWNDKRIAELTAKEKEEKDLQDWMNPPPATGHAYKKDESGNWIRKSINYLSIKHLPGIHNQQLHAGREISDERRAQLREWGRKGGKVRGAQMTSDDMKALRAKVKTESLIRSGRLGYEAIVAKYGKGYAASLFADYRRSNPSANSQKVSNWLDAANVKYEEEVSLRPNMYADFVIPKQHSMKKPIMLECDEEIWHRKDPLHGEDRPAIDKLKNIVAKEMGYDVVRVTGTQIRDGSAEHIILGKIRTLKMIAQTLEELETKYTKHLPGVHNQQNHAGGSQSLVQDLLDDDSFSAEEIETSSLTMQPILVAYKRGLLEDVEASEMIRNILNEAYFKRHLKGVSTIGAAARYVHASPSQNLDSILSDGLLKGTYLLDTVENTRMVGSSKRMYGWLDNSVADLALNQHVQAATEQILIHGRIDDQASIDVVSLNLPTSNLLDEDDELGGDDVASYITIEPIGPKRISQVQRFRYSKEAQKLLNDYYGTYLTELKDDRKAAIASYNDTVRFLSKTYGVENLHQRMYVNQGVVYKNPNPLVNKANYRVRTLIAVVVGKANGYVSSLLEGKMTKHLPGKHNQQNHAGGNSLGLARSELKSLAEEEQTFTTEEQIEMMVELRRQLESEEAIGKHLAGKHDQQRHAGDISTLRTQNADQISDRLKVAEQILASGNVYWPRRSAYGYLHTQNPALRRREFAEWCKDPASLVRILAIGEYAAVYSKEIRDAEFDKLLASGLIKKLTLANDTNCPEEYVGMARYSEELITFKRLYTERLLAANHPEFIRLERIDERENKQERIKEREKTSARTDSYTKPAQVVYAAAKIAGYKVIDNWKDLAELSNRHRNCVALKDNGWPDIIKRGFATIVDGGDATIAVAKQKDDFGTLAWELVDSAGINNISDQDYEHTMQFVKLLNELDFNSQQPNLHGRDEYGFTYKHLPGKHNQQNHAGGNVTDAISRRKVADGLMDDLNSNLTKVPVSLPNTSIQITQYDEHEPSITVEMEMSDGPNRDCEEIEDAITPVCESISNELRSFALSYGFDEEGLFVREDWLTSTINYDTGVLTALVEVTYKNPGVIKKIAKAIVDKQQKETKAADVARQMADLDASLQRSEQTRQKMSADAAEKISKDKRKRLLAIAAGIDPDTGEKGWWAEQPLKRKSILDTLENKYVKHLPGQQKHLPGIHDQQSHAGDRSAAQSVSAKFDMKEWEAKPVPDRIAQFNALSPDAKDALADAKHSVAKIQAERLSFAGKRPETGLPAEASKARLSQIGDFIAGDASKRIQSTMVSLSQNLKDSGVDDNQARSIVLEAIDSLAVQENESLGRTLGDHGVRHSLSNAHMALNILDQVPGQDSPQSKAAVTLAAIFHDTGYTTEPAQIFLDSEHPRWSAQHYENNLQPMISNALGADTASKIRTMIETHADTTIDWKNDPVSSALRVADNVSLFKAEKLPGLFHYVPDAIPVLERLGKQEVSIDDAKKEILSQVASSRLSPKIKTALSRSAKEMNLTTPKFTLGMLGGQIKNFTWSKKANTLDVNIERNETAKRLQKELDLGQRQFKKFAETYKVDPAKFETDSEFAFPPEGSPTALRAFVTGAALKSLMIRLEEKYLKDMRND